MSVLDTASLVIITGSIITVLGVIVILLRRKQRDRSITETNYRSLFNVGIIYLAAGLTITIASKMMNPLLILGFIFFIIGIANKDQWKTT